MGIAQSVRALLAGLPNLVADSVLDAGSPRAIVAQWAVDKGLRTAYCHLELGACSVARAEGAGRFGVHHSDELPAGPYEAVVLDSFAFEPAYAREVALQAAKVLTPKGVLVVAVPTEQAVPVWREHLAQAYKTVDIADGSGIRWGGMEAGRSRSPQVVSIIVASRPRGLPFGPVWEHWHLRWNSHEFCFVGGAGAFSPRGLDLGTQSMLEVIPAPAAGSRLLDLGCGTGAVAVIAAACWGCSVTAVDVNARALRLTSINTRRNRVGERVDVRASDGLVNVGSDPFDLIVTNPPYHTDYAVAKSFIEGAKPALSPGGSLWLVVKRPDWYVNKVRNVFGGCRLLESNGYAILQAEHRTGTRHVPKRPTTTRKHRKRLEEAARRKRS